MSLTIEYIAFLLPVALVLAVALAARSAMTLFVVEVRNGQAQRVSGRIPPSLLNEFLVACPRGLDSRLVILCRIEQGRARLVTQGPLTEDTIQQLRNLLGLWPLARLRSAPKIRKSRRTGEFSFCVSWSRQHRRYDTQKVGARPTNQADGAVFAERSSGPTLEVHRWWRNQTANPARMLCLPSPFCKYRCRELCCCWHRGTNRSCTCSSLLAQSTSIQGPPW